MIRGTEAIGWVLRERNSFYIRLPSCILLNLESRLILLDPGSQLSEEEIRAIERLDVIAVTQDRSYHYSRDLVVRLARQTDAAVVTNKAVFKDLRRLVPDENIARLRPGESVDLDGLRIHALRAVHPGLNPLVFLIETDEAAAFHGSGTAYSTAFRAFAPVDIAFVPVGGTSPTASVNDAIRIARILSASTTVPINGSEDELAKFAERAKKALPSVNVIVPEDGAAYRIPL
ncbi:MAG: MBL fold metallo-hydrolase [Candidatus Korarchaeota archaeon]|nr:MBL fold metallo-hydrolase [Candidatus Korarchaeota archaeon]